MARRGTRRLRAARRRARCWLRPRCRTPLSCQRSWSQAELHATDPEREADREPAGVLPRGGDDAAGARRGDDGSVAAGAGMGRRLPAGGQRLLGRQHSVCADGRAAAGGRRHRRHQPRDRPAPPARALPSSTRKSSPTWPMRPCTRRSSGAKAIVNAFYKRAPALHLHGRVRRRRIARRAGDGAAAPRGSGRGRRHRLHQLRHAARHPADVGLPGHAQDAGAATFRRPSIR